MTKQALFFSSLFIFSVVLPMENPLQEDKDNNKNARRTYMVYSHGFNEQTDNNQQPLFLSLGQKNSMPFYPDASGPLAGAVYTKPAVHILANHLHEIAQKEDCESIRLVGRSCGAGTAINCLAKLAHYNDNVEYFKDTDIRSKEDADTIMLKINNGAFVATAPLLHVRKTNHISVTSKMLAGATVVGLTAGACYLGSSVSKNGANAKLAQWGFVAAGIAAYCAFRDSIKKFYGDFIVRRIVPWVINKGFDSHHETPLQSAQQLRGKLTCPTLLHFNEHDELDEDTVEFYDALRRDNTHIIITNDGRHNKRSYHFEHELTNFNAQYLQQNKPKLIDSFVENTQPTVKQLRKQIRDQQTFIGDNVPYLGGIAVAGTVIAGGLLVHNRYKEPEIEYAG